MFLQIFFKKVSREASNRFSRNISALLYSAIWFCSRNNVWQSSFLNFLHGGGGKMGKTSRINLWCYLKGVMSLKLIKQLVESPRQSYYCAASKMWLFLLDSAGVFYVMEKWDCWQIWICSSVEKKQLQSGTKFLKNISSYQEVTKIG